MIRSSSFIVSILLAVSASGLLYHASYAVQADERRLAAINAQIAQAQDGIRVLKAEQAYLEAPARIERLARADLKMGPLDTTRQVKSLKQFLSTPTDSVPQLVSDATPTTKAPTLRHDAKVAAAAGAGRGIFHGDRAREARLASLARRKPLPAPRLILTAERAPDPLQNLIAKLGQ